MCAAHAHRPRWLRVALVGMQGQDNDGCCARVCTCCPVLVPSSGFEDEDGDGGGGARQGLEQGAVMGVGTGGASLEAVAVEEGVRGKEQVRQRQGREGLWREREQNWD